MRAYKVLNRRAQADADLRYGPRRNPNPVGHTGRGDVLEVKEEDRPSPAPSMLQGADRGVHQARALRAAGEQMSHQCVHMRRAVEDIYHHYDVHPSQRRPGRVSGGGGSSGSTRRIVAIGKPELGQRSIDDIAHRV